MIISTKGYKATLAGIAVGALLSCAGSAAAIEPYAARPQEIVLMPEYCQAKLGGAAFAGMMDSWPQRFGDMWLHLHHFCEGLKFIQRAGRPGISKEDRSFYLMSALSEIDYTLRASPADHWFAQEIHLKKALIYSRLGRQSEAATEYQLARKAGP